LATRGRHLWTAVLLLIVIALLSRPTLSSP
jgi:hypothetical protein